jgi:hypothetical protein
MLKRLVQIFSILYFTSSVIIGQIYIDYKNINTKDVIDALAFSGVEIFKFEVDSLIEQHKFYLILEEYAGKDNLINTDTLIGQKPFEIESKNINEIRFITKIENSSYETTYLYISTPVISTWKEIKMDNKYIRKHYWIKFAKTKIEVDKNIPLLFYASEWDTIFNGERTTRFCSMKEIPVDLSGDAIIEMPHFFIINYLIK